jgi:hypothetical protein
MSLIDNPQAGARPDGVGSIEQRCDNVDLLAHPEHRSAIQSLYRRLILYAPKKPPTRRFCDWASP